MENMCKQQNITQDMNIKHKKHMYKRNIKNQWKTYEKICKTLTSDIGCSMKKKKGLGCGRGSRWARLGSAHRPWTSGQLIGNHGQMLNFFQFEFRIMSTFIH